MTKQQLRREVPRQCRESRAGPDAGADDRDPSVAALASDDELLLVGWPSARRLLDATLLVDATREYVVHGHVPSSWVWRKLTRRAA